MLRYILVLVLINTSYRSLGVPVNPPPNLTRSLTTLADHCENAYLSAQIKNNIELCTEFASPHGEKQLQCLMFYDINMQLCSAVSAAKLALTEDYSARIKEEQDVNSMCVAAKQWVFSNLTEFSRYKQVVDKLFKSPVSCGKICSVEDFMSDDSNFFCKYFKWGSEMLHQVSPTTSKVINEVPESASAVDKPVPSEPNSDLQDVQINKNEPVKDQKSTPSVTPLNNEPVKTEEGKVESSSLPVNQQSQPQAPIPEMPVANENAGVEDTGPMPENVGNQPSKAPEDIPPKADPVQESLKAEAPVDDLNKVDDTNKGDDLKSDVEKELQAINNGKDPVLEGPQVKQPNDMDDLDAEEGKEGLQDSVGDDDDDSILNDFDAKPEVIKNDKKEKTVVSTLNEDQDGSNKIDYYGNPSQDLFPDNDDHFFPFFLTAVILVVLLYVLYHNKNKVGKVFFGLMLEGRSGRRRNSRGHSYRRLDTLEQAMSAKTAAPPSKIIY